MEAWLFRFHRYYANNASFVTARRRSHLVKGFPVNAEEAFLILLSSRTSVFFHLIREILMYSYFTKKLNNAILWTYGMLRNNGIQLSAFLGTLGFPSSLHWFLLVALIKIITIFVMCNESAEGVIGVCKTRGKLTKTTHDIFSACILTKGGKSEKNHNHNVRRFLIQNLFVLKFARIFFWSVVLVYKALFVQRTRKPTPFDLWSLHKPQSFASFVRKTIQKETTHPILLAEHKISYYTHTII